MTNSPLQRYCLRCWKLRPGWLPDQPEAKVQSDAKSDAKVKRSPKKRSNPSAVNSYLDLSSDSEGETGFIKKMKIDCNSKCDSFDSGIQTTSQESSQKSPEYAGFRRTFLNYQTENDGKDKAKDATTNSKSTQTKAMSNTTSQHVTEECIICHVQPKTGSLIHGSTGHQVCCYRCAKRLKRHKKPCPVCRKPIQKVIRNYNI